MWVTEVLSRVRGEEVQLQNKLGSGWVCDPHFEVCCICSCSPPFLIHFQVHFQPNAYDCGVHMLWHLRHLLEFRQIKLSDDCSVSQLQFTDNMVAKRLRLAQEMVEDAGLA